MVHAFVVIFFWLLILLSPCLAAYTVNLDEEDANGS